MPFGTQQAFFSRVELVAPVDDWRASRCVARCPACVCFFFWTLWRAASKALEQWCRMVLREAALLHLHKAALVQLSLRTLGLSHVSQW